MEKDFDFEEEEFETIVMTDDDGNETEFSIIVFVEHNNTRYLLVIESEYMDDENAEATILKEISTDNDIVVYKSLDSEEEFDIVASLLQEKSEEYDVEIEDL